MSPRVFVIEVIFVFILSMLLVTVCNVPVNPEISFVSSSSSVLSPLISVMLWECVDGGKVVGLSLILAQFVG